MKRSAVVAALAALAVAASGCYSKQKAAPRSGAPAAAVLVTRDFGARAVVQGRVATGQDALSALRELAKVGTSYGGRFVQSVDGVAGSLTGEKDWFLYVDGVESSVGALDVQLRPGDRVWWDYHSWNGDYMSVPALVGAFPEPFLHGLHGEPPPLAVTGSGSTALRAALVRDGARLGGTAKPWRVLVGSDAELRRIPDYAALAQAGAGAHLMAFVQNGRVQVFDGRRVRPLAGARVAVWATKTDDDRRVVMAIAGLDAASARRAADAIARDPGLLAGRFAAAFDGAGHLVATGGRP
jgi:hypothetical protein